MCDNHGRGLGGGVGAEDRDMSPIRLSNTRSGDRFCESSGGIQQFLETAGRSMWQCESVSMSVKRSDPVDESGETLVSEFVPGSVAEPLPPVAGANERSQPFRQIVEMIGMWSAIGVGSVE